DVDEMLLVGQLGLFEHDVDFLHVRAGPRIQVDHGNVLWALRGRRETTGPGSVRQGGERPGKARLLRSCAASPMPRRLADGGGNCRCSFVTVLPLRSLR